ncbi:MAG: hypothetical protein AAFZ67_02035 [Planctomycetota bacterium]
MQSPLRPLWYVAMGLFVLPTFGCEPAVSPIDLAAANVAAAGRVATTDALETAFLEGEITFEASLEAAEAGLAAGDPGATAFAGAVLDLAIRIEDRFPTGPEFELFWYRIGRLAGEASTQAMREGRFDEAAALVLAGPKRWQRPSYWQQYPNHDIVAALSLAQQGRSRDGIARLNSRPIVSPEMEAAIAQIRELERQRLRERVRQRVEAEADAAAGGG